MSTVSHLGDDYAGAVLSADNRYRYVLWRRWQDGSRGLVLFVMLNPSTADHETDDATIRRCRGYAKAWGYDGVAVVNLYAYRATNPRELSRVSDPVGAENDRFLKAWAETAPLIVCAWGVEGEPYGAMVAARLHRWAGKPLYAIALTSRGIPRHPLRLPAGFRPRLWFTADGICEPLGDLAP